MCILSCRLYLEVYIYIYINVVLFHVSTHVYINKISILLIILQIINRKYDIEILI